VPKVIDFGVVKATSGKLTDQSMSTAFGMVVGTLEYMAPEQAGYSGEDIEHAGGRLFARRDSVRTVDRASADRCQASQEGGIDRDDPHHPRTGTAEAEHSAVDESLPSPIRVGDMFDRFA
jgi:serine/threonine protein kinase